MSNFLGVFNDNFIKHSIVFIAVTWTLPKWMSQSQLISLVSAGLVFPYLILSPYSGKLSSIYSKQKVLRFFKVLEIFAMFVASIAFYFKFVWVALACVFIMGILSCMYSPSKYGLIRDIGGPEGVSFGSGVFETMAFLGITLGTVGASYISDHYNLWIHISLFLGIAVLGYLTARMIDAEEPPAVAREDAATVNPVRFLMDSYKFAKKHKYINCAVFGASIFWLVAGMIQMNLIIHCVKTLGSTNTAAGGVLACAAIGIALGCTTAGMLAKDKVEPKMIPVGLLGLILSLAAIIIFNPPIAVCAILIFILAFMGGIFEVPCMALVQNANVGRKLGDMIAYLNFTTFIFVLIGTLLFSATTLLTCDNSLAVFGVIMAVCLITMVYYAVRYPEFFMTKSKKG